jgi:chromosome segregation ATPase
VVQGTDIDIWKELAIGKQILLRTVTDALDLNPESGEEELKIALEKGVKQITTAESTVSAAKKENEAALSSMEARLKVSEGIRLEHELTIGELKAQKAATEALLDTTRKSNELELKKATTQLEEKKKQLKAINVALADTPENVVKKIKTLNKKKFDEASARKRLEDELRNLKKEKREMQDRNEKLESTSSQSVILAEKYRELQTLCETQFEQLKPLVDDETTLAALPELDEELLNSIDQAA